MFNRAQLYEQKWNITVFNKKFIQIKKSRFMVSIVNYYFINQLFLALYHFFIICVDQSAKLKKEKTTYLKK